MRTNCGLREGGGGGEIGPLASERERSENGDRWRPWVGGAVRQPASTRNPRSLMPLPTIYYNFSKHNRHLVECLLAYSHNNGQSKDRQEGQRHCGETGGRELEEEEDGAKEGVLFNRCT